MSKPRAGDIKIPHCNFGKPISFSDEKPPLAIAAPASPPIRACEELEGSP